MRVLYAAHTSVMSGAELTLLDLLHALPERIDPVVVCPSGELRTTVEALGVRWMSMPGTTGSLRPHVVHTPRAIMGIADSAVQLRRIAQRCGAEFIHANSLRASLIAVGAHALGGPPFAAHLHDAVPDGALGRTLARRVAASSSVVLANSDFTARSFEKHMSGDRRVVTVDNPVDIERFDPSRRSRDMAREQLGLPADVPLAGVVGQITPWKGQSDAIRALAIARREHPALQLVIAGSAKFVDTATRYDNTAYEASLHSLARQLDISQAVIFTGQLTDIPALMAALDIVLVPSWEEPFGRVIIEAMAMAKPVIATSAGGPTEIVSDGIDGALLAPRDPDAWAAQLRTLLATPKRMEDMGARARDSVAARFALPHFAARVIAAYSAQS